jgi:hypothetical protein
MERHLSDLILSLEKICYFRDNAVIDGFPGSSEWRRISFDGKSEMFKLDSGYFLNGTYDSVCNNESYYFSQKDFLSLAERLIQDNKCELNNKGIYVFEKGISDHSGASFEDYADASAQIGIISGNLKLENNLLAQYKLDFKPIGDKKEIKDDCSSYIKKEEIEKLIRELF